MNVSMHPFGEVNLLVCENDWLRLGLVPSNGGKIASIFNKPLQREFLWTNASLSLQPLAAGSEYDPNFYGGMDELIPNDIPERVDGIEYPDHGELWTTPLDYQVLEDSISVFGDLPKSGLFYQKSMRMDRTRPAFHLDYRIRNDSGATRKFLWKLHPALRIEAGDRLVTTAARARVVDPAYSRFHSLEEFAWPWIEGVDASRVPPQGGEVDFFFLWKARKPEMNFISRGGSHLFSLQYDPSIFPYQWYFASYGGFLNHYTAVLEPCTAMPLSVNEAAHLGQCTNLEPGQSLETSVRIYAGENIPEVS